MGRNFYLRKLAEAVAASANFAALLVSEGTSLGISATQSAAFGVVNTALQACWTASSTPDTRTPVAVEATRVALKNMRAAAIPLAKQIVGNPAVTDAQLVALGLLPRTSPTPIPAEMTPPEVDLVSCTGRLAKLRIRQAGVESNARPAGSAGALVYAFVGPSAPSDPNEFELQGLATRRYTEVLFGNDVPSGATAWISCAWVSRRGQRGFGSVPISVTIQGGALPAGETA